MNPHTAIMIGYTFLLVFGIGVIECLILLIYIVSRPDKKRIR